ncbi:hypothetical protein [Collimonas sp.]|jgi:hypothetical protein|uniref:hypothetical protein n=1 Tax=Collimonas sp. TaxID=1963772 RepID=UPI0037BE47D2
MLLPQNFLLPDSHRAKILIIAKPSPLQNGAGVQPGEPGGTLRHPSNKLINFSTGFICHRSRRIPLSFINQIRNEFLSALIMTGTLINCAKSGRISQLIL